jgi:hypothetical protein
MQKIPESIGSKYRFITLAAERAKKLRNNAKVKICKNSNNNCRWFVAHAYLWWAELLRQNRNVESNSAA